MKRLAIAAIATVAIVFAVAFAGPVLVPSDFVKARVASLVLRATGRDLRIAGSISFSLLPRVRLIARNVALASPAGDFSGDFVTAPRVEISLRPLALLRGAVEIDQLRLSEPAISFEIDRQGRRNWIFRRTAPTAPGASPAGSAGPPIAFGTLAIADGEARYADRRDGTKLATSGIAMTATLPHSSGPLNATGTAIYNGERIKSAVYLASPELLHRGAASGLSLDMTAARGSVAFRGEIGGAEATAAAGLMELKIPSLPDFLAWMRLTRGVRLPGPLSITSRIEAGGGKLALSDARITLGTIAAEGAVSVDRSAGRPSITGRLAIQRLDLDPFLKRSGETAAAHAAPTAGPPPASAETPPVAVSPSAPVWSRATIDLAPLKLVDAELHLTADTIRLRHIVAGNNQMHIHLKNGRLDLDIAAAALYGGKGTGKIVIDGGGPIPAFGVRFYLTGIRFSRAPLGIAGLGELSGTGDMSLDLIGRGNNMREAIESLNGIGGFDFTDGTIGSAGLGPLMRDALGPAVNDKSVPREIRYHAFSGTAAIARGILRNGDLKLLSPQLSATAAGTLDLVSRRIDYLWQPDIPGVGSARIAVTGAWDAPGYKVQSATIGKPAKQPARKRR